MPLAPARLASLRDGDPILVTVGTSGTGRRCWVRLTRTQICAVNDRGSVLWRFRRRDGVRAGQGEGRVRLCPYDDTHALPPAVARP